jgi:predicted RNase H-like HicB family nuclease
MLTDYIAEAMARASYKILEDGTCFGEIPSLHGVWSNEATLEECRKVLQEVLEEWLLLKLRDDDEIPPLSERLFAKQG